MVQNTAKLSKNIHVLYETIDRELNFVLNIQSVSTWAFLRMHNSKLGKQPMRRRGPFATSRTKGNLSCTTLLIKWLSDVQRNSFVSNNSRMSTDRPKPTGKHIIRPNVRTVYAKVF